MKTTQLFLVTCLLIAGGSGCRTDTTAPTGLRVPTQASQNQWGPETPNFNLEVILRGDGFGHVKFRQPNDDALIVYLDTWVRGLEPIPPTFYRERSTRISTESAPALPGLRWGRD